MSFRLNKQKATQAAAVLLRCAPNRQMSRLRLLKLLYMADRESLAEKGRPITGDRVVAMDHGPVLSGIYDLIKNTHPDPAPWSSYFRSQHNDVILESDPGVGDLSRYEVGKLQEIWCLYEDVSDWELVDKVVHAFQEWLDNKPEKGSTRNIPFADILRAVGRENDISSILQDTEEEQKLDRFWSRVTHIA